MDEAEAAPEPEERAGEVPEAEAPLRVVVAVDRTVVPERAVVVDEAMDEAMDEAVEDKLGAVEELPLCLGREEERQKSATGSRLEEAGWVKDDGGRSRPRPYAPRSRAGRSGGSVGG